MVDVFQSIQMGNLLELKQFFRSRDRKRRPKRGIYNQHGFSLQTFAVAHKQLEIVKWLVAHGYSLSQADRGMRTPLSLATTELIPELVVLGADVNYVVEPGDTTELMDAIRFDRTDEAIKLLHCGADPNTQDYCGKTALMYAIEERNYRIMQVLVTIPYTDLSICCNDGKAAFTHLLEVQSDAEIFFAFSEDEYNGLDTDDYMPTQLIRVDSRITDLLNAYLSALAYRFKIYQPLYWLAWQMFANLEFFGSDQRTLVISQRFWYSHSVMNRSFQQFTVTHTQPRR